MQAPYPKFDEDYFEWIDLLESVVAARRSYTMIELGAGMGRWSVRGASAVRQFHRKLPFHLIAVEAEPTHYEWMRLHFRDNGLDPDTHTLIHAAIGATPGEVSFYVGSNEGDVEPNAWYGQSVTKSYEVDVQVEEEFYRGYQVRRHESGAKSVTVPAITLGSILDGAQLVDLIDVDIQGLEFVTILPAIDALDTKVKRLHIGTHGHDIEDQLRQLMASHGWQCLADYPSSSKAETPFGTIEFQDGVQSWVNPRFAGWRGRFPAFIRALHHIRTATQGFRWRAATAREDPARAPEAPHPPAPNSAE